ncbi:MAG: DUF2510 domain-containing protein [Acidimicrobiales bacterium]
MPHPGWYTDPQDAHGLRWWDGSQWTDETLPSKPAAGPAPRRPAHRRAPTVPGPVFWAGFAVLAAIIAIAAFVGVQGLLADDDDGSDDASGSGARDTSATTASSTTTSTTDPALSPRFGGPDGPANIAVLVSLSQSESSLGDAVTQAEGIADIEARVLDSNTYETDRERPLTDGLWVIWTGPFDTLEVADAFCTDTFGESDCFPLHVFPLGE